MNVGERERVTQNRVVKLFKDKLGYTYLGDFHDRDNSNIEVEYLTRYLKKAGYSSAIIKKTINEFVSLAGNQQLNLYDLNKGVYSALRYGMKLRENPGESPITVMLIDWKAAENNNFYIAEEVTVKSNNSSVLILYYM